MYYILKISTKAFVIAEENGDLTIVQNPERASRYEKIGDAMKKASEINTDWEANVVQIVRVG